MLRHLLNGSKAAALRPKHTVVGIDWEQRRDVHDDFDAMQAVEPAYVPHRARVAVECRTGEPILRARVSKRLDDDSFNGFPSSWHALTGRKDFLPRRALRMQLEPFSRRRLRSVWCCEP